MWLFFKQELQRQLNKYTAILFSLVHIFIRIKEYKILYKYNILFFTYPVYYWSSNIFIFLELINVTLSYNQCPILY